MLLNYSHKIKRFNYKNLFYIFIVLILIYFSGCSSAKRFKTLSFFFDGVPDPSIKNNSQTKDFLSKNKDTATLTQNSVKNVVSKMNFHLPYQDKTCESCHDQNKMGKLNQEMPELCYQCHDNFSYKYKVLHGPVGGGQCTACHSPHSSVNSNLLLRKGQELCLYCHISKQIMETETHRDIGETDCTDCHNPHGGEDRYVLR